MAGAPARIEQCVAQPPAHVSDVIDQLGGLHRLLPAKAGICCQAVCHARPLQCRLASARKHASVVLMRVRLAGRAFQESKPRFGQVNASIGVHSFI